MAKGLVMTDDKRCSLSTPWERASVERAREILVDMIDDERLCEKHHEKVNGAIAWIDMALAAEPLSERTAWPNPDDWNLVCPKCGSSPDGECGWPTNCPTGMAEKKGIK
jgi:hypothetical protein